MVVRSAPGDYGFRHAAAVTSPKPGETIQRSEQLGVFASEIIRKGKMLFPCCLDWGHGSILGVADHLNCLAAAAWTLTRAQATAGRFRNGRDPHGNITHVTGEVGGIEFGSL
jgi:hypothetical protein